MNRPSRRVGLRSAHSILRGLRVVLFNEILRVARRVGTVQYSVRLTCHRCTSQGKLGTTRIIPHYPTRLARALGLPRELYSIQLYADKIAQDAFCSNVFGTQFRPGEAGVRDFANGLVQVDFHERMHVFLRAEGLSMGDPGERSIEWLDAKLARSLFPEYGDAGPRPWHSHCCTECHEGRSATEDRPTLQTLEGDARPAPRRLATQVYEVT